MTRIERSTSQFHRGSISYASNSKQTQVVSESNIERKRSSLVRRKTGTTPANAVHLRHVPWLQGSFPSFLHRNEFRFFVDVVCPPTHPPLAHHLHASLRVLGQL